MKILNESNFVEATSSGVTLVDFWAPWCPPCNAMMPMVTNLAAEYEGRAVFGKVNISEQDGLATKYNVSSIPTMMFFKDGVLVSTLVGMQSEKTLRAKLGELLG